MPPDQAKMLLAISVSALVLVLWLRRRVVKALEKLKNADPKNNSDTSA